MTNNTTATPNKRARADDLIDQFTSFRAELDQSQAQRERIVKTSRDITALSKQMIFALHRVSSGKDWNAVKREVEQKLKDLRTLFAKIQDEVKGQDFWRYERSISPGLQEYLEGFTFYHYLEHRTLPTLEQCQASLLPPPPAPSTGEPTAQEATTLESSLEEQGDEIERRPYVVVTPEDYLGGVADLTGELMRLAIASVGKSLNSSLRTTSTTTGEGEEEEGSFADIDKIGRLVREIKGQMDPLAPYARWLSKKLVVLDQSLAKIENASYNLKIRGAEYKDSPRMLQELAKNLASSSTTGMDRGANEIGA
ncbi:hypothetical protein JCM3766R1_001701 [Sporobolomyces carnicolor]